MANLKTSQAPPDIVLKLYSLTKCAINKLHIDRYLNNFIFNLWENLSNFKCEINNSNISYK